MNKVILSGVVKYPIEIRKSKNGNGYCKNIISVDRTMNKGSDNITFIVFGDKAMLLQKASQGSNVELIGEWHSNYDKDKKLKEDFLVVQEVNIYELEPQQDIETLDMADDVVDMADDDLPF